MATSPKRWKRTTARSKSFTVTEPPPPAGVPEITSPTAGSRLSTKRQKFHWTANGVAVESWRLVITDTSTGQVVYNRKRRASQTSTSVRKLPKNSALNVVLQYQGQRTMEVYRPIRLQHGRRPETLTTRPERKKARLRRALPPPLRSLGRSRYRDIELRQRGVDHPRELLERLRTAQKGTVDEKVRRSRDPKRHRFPFVRIGQILIGGVEQISLASAISSPKLLRIFREASGLEIALVAKDVISGTKTYGWAFADAIETV